MANSIASNPWVLDTVAATTDVWTGRIRVNHVEFSGYAVATDLIELTNSAGVRICLLTGATDFTPVRSGYVGDVHGVRVKQISAASTGTILVYIE